MIQEKIVTVLIGVIAGLLLGAWAKRRETKKFRCRRGCCVNKAGGKS